MKDIYRSFENFENERYLLRAVTMKQLEFRPGSALLIGEDGYAYNGYWENAQI